jgi:hypothetical protein
VKSIQFGSYPLGTPVAGDFSEKQDLLWEDSEDHTRDLPEHSFAVEGETTVTPQAPEGLLNVVGSAVGGVLKHAAVQLVPQLPPAELFRRRRQIPGPTRPLKDAGPVPGEWENTVIYHQQQPKPKMEPTRQHRQQSETNVRRDPADVRRDPVATARTTAPPAPTAANVRPVAHEPTTTETTTGEGDRDKEFLTALCARLTLSIKDEIMPRIRSIEDKLATRPRDPESRDPQFEFQGEPGPEYRAYRGFDDRDGYHSRDWNGKPRFRPDSLPKVKYGDDVSVWIAEMDHAVLQHGEEIVCPEIFANCFTSGDAIKLWYMGMPSEFRTMLTTKVGCWDRFKSVMQKRFTVDIGVRQMAAEDRFRMPGESYADFAIQKVFLIQRAFEHLAPSAVIAMVKRKLDWEAAAFCREMDSIDDFVSELIQFDNLRAMKTYSNAQRQSRQWSPRTGQGYRDSPSAFAPTNPSGYQPRFNDYMAGAPGQTMGPPPIQRFQTAPNQRFQTAPNQNLNMNSSIQNTGPVNQGYTDPRLPTVQARKHPQTGVDTLSYLDRSGRTVFIQRPCQHCEVAGKKNAWHFDFSCADKPLTVRRARTYAGEAELPLPGTFDSPSGHQTSYTFNGLGNGYAGADDPNIEDNPFYTDDVWQSGNAEWDQ